MPVKSRNWCFTINNPEHEPDFSELDIKYGVMQLEIGDSGTVHWQGFVQLNSARAASYLKNWEPTAHLEVMRGTPQQARDYCMKPGSLEPPVEFGTWEAPAPGKRNDLLEVKRLMDSGKRVLDIARDDGHFSTVIKHQRGLQWYEANTAEVDQQPIRVIVITGPTGTGKTTHAKGYGEFWAKSPDSGNWWDGYRGEPVVIFDEFKGKGISMEAFNMLYDRTSVWFPIKGGFTKVCAHTFVFVSNVAPMSWWPDAHFPAFCRRVTEWINMPTLGHQIKTFNYNDYVASTLVNVQ